MANINVQLNNLVNHKNSVAQNDWSVVRDAATGTDSAVGNLSGAPTYVGQVVIYCGSTTNKFQWINRFAIGFDTSAIGAGKIITGATLSIANSFNKFKTFASSDFAINCFSYVGSLVAANNGDFSKYGTTPFCDTDQPYGSSEPRGFVLNAAGLAAINPTGLTAFGIREARHDAADSAIWGSGNSYVDWDNRNSTSYWSLSVDYVNAPTSSALWRMS